MTDYPITPPPELVQQWKRTAPHILNDHEHYHYITFCAAQWGADQELLACGNYLEKCAAWEPEDVTEFYNYRRPKPPSLKEQAMQAWCRFQDTAHKTADEMMGDMTTIRLALEQLDD